MGGFSLQGPFFQTSAIFRILSKTMYLSKEGPRPIPAPQRFSLRSTGCHKGRGYQLAACRKPRRHIRGRSRVRGVSVTDGALTVGCLRTHLVVMNMPCLLVLIAGLHFISRSAVW